jgi:acetoin utilization deacetylase AcuC-like enzyme
VKFFYSKRYDLGGGLPLNDVHGFVLDRPTRTRDALVARHGVAEDAFVEASTVDVGALAAVHDTALVAALQRSAGIAAAVEMPLLRYAPDFLARRAVLLPQLAAAGGTRDALALAADGGWAVNLSGGFHHARPARAHGFCLINDVALAIHALRARGVRPRIAIVDLDAHQGDGNAAAFAEDDDVFTLSVHEQGLFPHPKLTSSVDIGLDAGTDDDGFAAAVDAGLDALRKQVTPDVVIYVAGVDPHVNDPLSSLRVSAAGLVRRDARVARFAKDAGAGLVVVPAGGYTKASPLLSAAGMAAIAALAP